MLPTLAHTQQNAVADSVLHKMHEQIQGCNMLPTLAHLQKNVVAASSLHGLHALCMHHNAETDSHASELAYPFEIAWMT